MLITIISKDKHQLRNIQVEIELINTFRAGKDFLRLISLGFKKWNLCVCYNKINWEMKKDNRLVLNGITYQLNPKLCLGKGGEGQVFKGLRQTDQRTVAIKKIKENDSPSQITAYLFHCSLKAYKLFNHPNILKVQGLHREYGYCYIISELCQGGTLSKLIKTKEKLSEKEALNIFEGIVEGYFAIFNEGILHRDLKTENILLRKNNEPVIIDFGTCDFLASKDRPKISYNVGSELYMAPEAFNKNSYSEKSDIWSLGIILNEMLTGSHLKIKTKTMEKYFKDLAQKEYLEVAFSYSTDIIGVILRKCLAVSVEQRATAGQLRTMIKEWRERNKTQN